MNLETINDDEIESNCFRNIKNRQDWWVSFRDLYIKTKDYLDDDFWKKDPIHKSDKNFKSKLWEMIVINYFIEKDSKIIKTTNKIKKGGPDIQIQIKSGRYLCVECVVATRGNNPNEKFYENQHYNGTVEEYNRSKIVRLCNSIEEKYDKLQKYYQNNIVAKNDLYIIAVNSDFGVDTFELDNLERLLYGKADMVTELNVENKTRKDYFNQKLTVNKITKKGEFVDLNNGIFLNSAYENLTGVLYSGFPNINSMERSCFSMGFNKNFSKIQSEVEQYFCSYSFLEGDQLMRKLI